MLCSAFDIHINTFAANKQTEILEQCEKETAETKANFDKKYGPMLKEDTIKSKEKLLRDVLDKL